jgi:segregation and condensation protein B
MTDVFDIGALERQIEALLFAAAGPLSLDDLAERLPEGAQVAVGIEALAARYAVRGVNLVCVAGRWRVQTAEDLAYLMTREREEPRRLSKAAQETLAIIAYHQPVTRAEIEAVRGVQTRGGALDVLLELGLVKMRGRRRTPGRPVTFGTTFDAEVLLDGALGVATVQGFQAGSVTSSFFARLTADCPATITNLGAGCVGSAGPGQLAPSSLPWIDATYAALVTGCPPQSLGLSMFSKSTTALSLPQLLPEAGAGCTLWVPPDLSALLVPTAGVATTSFPVPAVGALVGIVLHHQVALLEFASAGGLTALTVTNAVSLTIGSF